VEIDLSHSGLDYTVGDSIAVLPSNLLAVVEKIVSLLGFTGHEKVCDPRTKDILTLGEFLLKRANLNCSTQKLRAALDDKVSSSDNDVVDILEASPKIQVSPQEFCECLRPLLPRFYSIASSQKAVGDEVHLAVAFKQWNHNGRPRSGIASHFLCFEAPLNIPSIPLYVQPHRGFTLPEDSGAPVIMVGPGTGIAPFRAFMQEREIVGATGKNWLFFGEWNQKHHYFYEDFWRSLQQKGKLRMNVAFSRDQKQKIYVQHRMIEKGKEIYDWLQEGAFFYVCGDASRMAKDVESALLQIIQQHGSKSADKAKEFIRSLRKEKRYLRDIY